MLVLASPTVIVADDLSYAVDFYLRQVNAAFNGVASAGCLDSLRSMLRVHLPHIALLDVRMQNEHNILDLIPELQLISPATRMIIMTSFPELAPAGRAFALGVRGYLEKDFSVDELHASIREVHDGGGYLMRSRMLREQTRILTLSKPLSVKQLQVFNSLRQGMTHARIAGEVGMSVSTLENHVTEIRLKFGISREPSHTRWQHIVCPTIDWFEV